MHIHDLELVAEGEGVVARFRLEVTRTGGEKLVAQGLTYYRLADGRITLDDPFTRPDLAQAARRGNARLLRRGVLTTPHLGIALCPQPTRDFGAALSLIVSESSSLAGGGRRGHFGRVSRRTGAPHETSRVDDRPIEACFAYLSDLANDVEWRREWIDTEKATDGPTAWAPGTG